MNRKLIILIALFLLLGAFLSEIITVEFVLIAIVAVLLAPTLWKGFKALILAVIGIFGFMLALFVPIRKCKCGCKDILVRNYDGEYVLQCYGCRKRTHYHKYLLSAKSEWSRIRGL